MSLAALLIGTRDTLKTKLRLSDGEVEVRLDGRPSNLCGQRFISVHPTSWSPNDDLVRAIAEEYGISVTATLRTNAIPIDKWADDAILDPMIGLEEMCRQIAVSVHQSYDLLILANRALEARIKRLGNIEDRIIEPLRWVGTEAAPVPRTAAWFFSPAAPNTDEDYMVGMSMEIRFQGGKRIQRLDPVE